jgi:hypothetical protein
MNDSDADTDRSQPTRVGHCKQDSCTVYIGRNRVDGELKHMNNTPIGDRGWLGNPYPLDDGYSREESVALFVEDLLDRVESDPEFREALYELQGEILGCWCQQLDADKPLCHGEALAQVIDAIEPR